MDRLILNNRLRFCRSFFVLPPTRKSPEKPVFQKRKIRQKRKTKPEEKNSGEENTESGCIKLGLQGFFSILRPIHVWTRQGPLPGMYKVRDANCLTE